MNNTIFTNYYEVAAVILFGIGLTTLLLHKNLIKKLWDLILWIQRFICS